MTNYVTCYLQCSGTRNSFSLQTKTMGSVGSALGFLEHLAEKALVPVQQTSYHQIAPLQVPKNPTTPPIEKLTYERDWLVANSCPESCVMYVVRNGSLGEGRPWDPVHATKGVCVHQMSSAVKAIGDGDFDYCALDARDVNFLRAMLREGLSEEAEWFDCLRAAIANPESLAWKDFVERDILTGERNWKTKENAVTRYGMRFRTPRAARAWYRAQRQRWRER